MFGRKTKPFQDFGEIRAFLGEGTSFIGSLQFDGTVRLDGRFEGDVAGSDLLIIGQAASVRAEIQVGSLVVGGRVEGNIVARKRVELLTTARVTGTIKTPSLVVGDGAILNGMCEMRREEAKVVHLDQKREEELRGSEAR
ncbi:MAG: polymer-forming cytoskeletal protein [Acidobacteria bacterium]|nr:polymer-forming cytoskeletal protein [Acidobacteriota bacterium]